LGPHPPGLQAAAEGGGGLSLALPEGFAEVVAVAEAGAGGHGVDRFVAVHQDFGGTLQAQVKVARRI